MESTPAAQLVLQYPDWQLGKIRLLATTNDKRALTAFKEAVLEEARLKLLACDDPILRIEYGDELHKLERLFSALVPESGRSEDA